jgi:hypothetical protein
MKKSENTEVSPSADFGLIVKQAICALVRAEAGRFALRGFSDQFSEDEWFEKDLEHLDAIVDLLETEHKKLWEYLHELRGE